MLYDVCIVGAGLVGTAAAKYACSSPNKKVCLVGPQESAVDGGRRDIYGSHYDAGRIYARASVNHVWARFGQKAISRYRQIESQSGVPFATDVGCLFAGSKGGAIAAYVNSAPKETSLIQSDQLKDTFPLTDFARDDEGLFEKIEAGYISPRRLLTAQLIIALNNGCDVIRDTVCQIDKIDEQSNAVLKIITDQGRVILAKKVLLATGAFVAYRNLIPRAQLNEIDWIQQPLTVMLGEVTVDDAKRLSKMPCVVYHGNGGPQWSADYPRSLGKIRFYMMPPILYPDGKFYIKIGHNSTVATPRGTMSSTEIRNWFLNGGDKELADHLKRLLITMFPGLEFQSFRSLGCVTMDTPTGCPYIDMLSDHLGIVIGCNGYGAKSSDELGKIAFEMISEGAWVSDIPHELFKLRYKKDKSKL